MAKHAGGGAADRYGMFAAVPNGKNPNNRQKPPTSPEAPKPPKQKLQLFSPEQQKANEKSWSAIKGIFGSLGIAKNRFGK